MNIRTALFLFVSLSILSSFSSAQKPQSRTRQRMERARAWAGQLEQDAKAKYQQAFITVNGYALYTTPTTILEPYGALLPLGIAYYHHRFGAGAEIGVPLMFSSFQLIEPSARKHIRSDFRLRIDGRFYFRKKYLYRDFLGLEMAYRPQHFTKQQASLYSTDIGAQYSGSYLDMKKTTYSIGSFMGRAYRVTKHLSLEWRAGLGLRWIVVHHNFTAANYVIQDGDNYLTAGLPPDEDQRYNNCTVVYIPLAVSLKYQLY